MAEIYSKGTSSSKLQIIKELSDESLGDAVSVVCEKAFQELVEAGFTRKAATSKVLQAMSNWVNDKIAQDEKDAGSNSGSTKGGRGEQQQNSIAEFVASSREHFVAALEEIQRAIDQLNEKIGKGGQRQELNVPRTSRDFLSSEAFEEKQDAVDRTELDDIVGTLADQDISLPRNHISPALTPAKGATESATGFPLIDFVVQDFSDPNGTTKYDLRQTRMILLKMAEVHKALIQKISSDTEWLQNAYTERIPEAEVVSCVHAAFLYSVDAKKCDCTSYDQCKAEQLKDSALGRVKHRQQPAKPENTAAHGWNGNHWAMMNAAKRAAEKPGEKAEVVAEAKKAVAFFAPLMERLNRGIQFFVHRPRVVYRGVNLPLAENYSIGTEIEFSPFTSTSLDGNEALKFMGAGGTFFVMSTASGALIEDYSHYPEQEEALVKTNTKFEVTSKMSRTLQLLLGNDFDVVFLGEMGITQSPAQQIKQLVACNKVIEFVFSKNKDKYIEAQLSLSPPPAGKEATATSSAKHYPLYKLVDYFTGVAPERYLLLLGAGGAGKTSATVGALRHMMTMKTVASHPLFPVFISLPSVGGLFETGGIDRHVAKMLRLDADGMQLLLSQVQCILLLDSLDEVVTPAGASSPLSAGKLMDLNPIASQMKCIVSCRTELLDAAQADPLTVLHTDPLKTLPMHIMPFNEKDRTEFMRRAAKGRIEELARQEADNQYIDMKESFGLADAELSHPCVLHIATNVMSAGSLDGSMPGSENRYSLYERFVRAPLKNARSKQGSPQFTDEQQEGILQALRQLATRMATEGSWQLPLADVKDAFATAMHESPPGAKTKQLLLTIPSRCEDLHSPTAMWGFWHKTIGEFLAASEAISGGAGAEDNGGNSSALQNHPEVQQFIDEGAWYRAHGGKTLIVPKSWTVASTMELLLQPSTKQNLVTLSVHLHSIDYDISSLKSFPNLQHLTLENNDDELKQGEERAKVGKIVNAVLSFKLESLALRNFFQQEVVPDRFMASQAFCCGKLDLSQSFPAAKKCGDSFLLGTKNLEEVVLPASFNNMEEIPKNFLEASDMKKLDLSQTFAAATKCGQYFLRDTKNLQEILWPPSFNIIEEVPEYFLCGSGVKKLDLSQTFSTAKKCGQGFLERTENLEEVVWPSSFSNMEGIPESFLNFSGIKKLDLSYTFPAAKKCGGFFLYRTSSLEDVVLPASFNHMEEVPKFFMARSGITKLDLSQTFLAAKECGESFLADTKNLEEVVWPTCFNNMEAIPVNFLSGSGIKKLDFSQTFTVATECGEGFLQKTKNLEEVVLPPSFNSMGEIPSSLMYGSGVKKLDLSQTFSAAKKCGANLLAETKNLEEILWPPSFNIMEEVPDYFLSGSGIKKLDLSQTFSTAKKCGQGFLYRTKNLEELLLPASFENGEFQGGGFLSGSKYKLKKR